LTKARRGLEYLTLEKPIRHGWFKHLTLRDYIARRKDAAVFGEILEVSGIDIWGRDKQHADKIWTKRAAREEGVQFPGFKKLHQNSFKKLSAKAQKWYEGFDWYWNPKRGNLKRYHCRVPQYYFKIAYTKAFITKMQVVNPEIEKRLDEIDKILTSREYYYCDVGNYGYRREFNPMFHRVTRRKMKRALLDYEEDDFDRRIYSTIQRW